MKIEGVITHMDVRNAIVEGREGKHLLKLSLKSIALLYPFYIDKFGTEVKLTVKNGEVISAKAL